MCMASRSVIESKRFSSENVGITKINYRREMFHSLKNHLLVLFISWVVCCEIYILELDIEKKIQKLRNLKAGSAVSHNCLRLITVSKSLYLLPSLLLISSMFEDSSEL